MTRPWKPCGGAAGISARFGRRGRTAPAPGQRGVALLTVLLLVAVMSVLVMGILDDIRFGLRRTANARAVAQAQRYALGAEAMARTRIVALAARDSGIATTGDWNGRTFSFPLDQAAGTVRVRVDDRSTCFNLNSVVEGAGEQWQRRALGARQFTALLRALDFSASDAALLSDSLVDWIDADQAALPRGAEDPHYLALPTGYRTAGTLLAEPSELRAIAGFDAARYARLRPYVCALPSDTLSPMNINLLQPGDAPLIAMLTLGEIDAGAARALVEARPVAGWRDAHIFIGLLAGAGHIAPPPVIDQIQLRTRYFGLHTEVEYGQAQVVMSALLEHDPSGEVRVHARRWSDNG